MLVHAMDNDILFMRSDHLCGPRPGRPPVGGSKALAGVFAHSRAIYRGVTGCDSIFINLLFIYLLSIKFSKCLSHPVTDTPCPVSLALIAPIHPPTHGPAARLLAFVPVRIQCALTRSIFFARLHYPARLRSSRLFSACG